jgi:hypothetical protein
MPPWLFVCVPYFLAILFSPFFALAFICFGHFLLWLSKFCWLFPPLIGYKLIWDLFFCRPRLARCYFSRASCLRQVASRLEGPFQNLGGPKMNFFTGPNQWLVVS